MRIIENFISLKEIKKIKDFYQHRQFDFIKNVYHASLLQSWVYDEILHDKIANLFGDYKITPNTDVYQRFTFAAGIHNDSKLRIAQDFDEIKKQPKFAYLTDNFATDYQHEGKVLLIPLDQGTSLHTVVWKEKCQGNVDSVYLKRLFQSFSQTTSNSGISKRYDLSHTYQDTDKRLCDYLTLDAVFDWKLGSAGIWDRDQLHCATNFDNKHSHKDAICIMFE